MHCGQVGPTPIPSGSVLQSGIQEKNLFLAFLHQVQAVHGLPEL